MDAEQAKEPDWNQMAASSMDGMWPAKPLSMAAYSNNAWMVGEYDRHKRSSEKGFVHPNTDMGDMK